MEVDKGPRAAESDGVVGETGVTGLEDEALGGVGQVGVMPVHDLVVNCRVAQRPQVAGGAPPSLSHRTLHPRHAHCGTERHTSVITDALWCHCGTDLQPSLPTHFWRYCGTDRHTSIITTPSDVTAGPTRRKPSLLTPSDVTTGQTQPSLQAASDGKDRHRSITAGAI